MISTSKKSLCTSLIIPSIFPSSKRIGSPTFTLVVNEDGWHEMLPGFINSPLASNSGKTPMELSPVTCKMCPVFTGMNESTGGSSPIIPSGMEPLLEINRIPVFM